MAPEQLSRDPEISTPTFASDVYSLGITLLSLLIGGDPFAEVASSLFMLREAVKMGDAVSFALRQPGYERRLEGVEKVWAETGKTGPLIKLVAVALVKKREARVQAGQWVEMVTDFGL
jgi:serine/threonine protein kinase